MMQEPYKTLHHFRKSELRADRADPKKGILTFGHSATLKKYSEIGEPLKKEYREIIEPQKRSRQFETI